MMENMKKILTPKRVLSLIVFILVLIFGFQNMGSVKLSIIFFSLDIPLLILIFAIYIIGVFTGWAVKRSDVKKIVDSAQDETRKEIKELQKQLKNK
ncbi:LapA family protein [Lactococcus piscium]|uniref:LapA family protein n=1 Tax=Pseudolactococcus carnosus TaxID=2749961 RepID=UPI001FBBC93C|nr:LapA family protein [Lactococcus carnosus]MCJ1995369.1 LapA family protein [Lactococcus carnosus]